MTDAESEEPHVLRIPVKDPLAPIPASRHPFQFWALVAFWFDGWITIIESPDTSFSQNTSHFINFIYGVLLILSTSLAIGSAWWRERITGLMLEKVGLTGLAMATVIYGVFLFCVFGLVGFFSATLNLGIGIASIWRIRHVNRELLATIRLINSRPGQE